MMVVVWTALSYSIPSQIPTGVPRRLFCPLPWEPESLYHWTVINDMGKIPAGYIFAAIIPAMMIARLYFFDHSVASQLAQQKEFNLKNPSAYHYDIFLFGVMNMIVMAPSDETELSRMVNTAVNINDRPVCFRYPRGAGTLTNHKPYVREPIEVGKGRVQR
ncbi:hypothetical protein ACP275_01G031800 [Erythranthe tilingii]